MSWVRKVLSLVRSVVRSEIAAVRTWDVGQVEEYDGATGKAKIRLCVRGVRTEDPENLTTADMPLLDDVPCFQFGSGKLLTSCAPQSESYGIVLYSHKDLEAWLTTGGTVDPGSSRRFSLSDAVFITGLYPFVEDGDNGQIQEAIKTDRVSLRTRDGAAEVSVLDNGDVLISVGSGATTITVSGSDVTIDNGTTSLAVGSTVNAGGGADFVALAALANANFDLINTIISNWTPVAQDGGAALKTAWAAAWAAGVQDVASSNLKAD